MALTKISTGMLKQDAASSDLNIDAGTLYLDVSNNRVGVANTSPTQALDVTGAIQTDTSFRAYDSVNTAYRNVLRYDGGNVRLETGTGSSASGIGMWTAGSERIHIDSSGNVGIGTTSLVSGDKLTVNGNLHLNGTLFNGTSNNSAGLNFTSNYVNLYGYAGIRFYAEAAGIGSMAERMRIDSSGNLLVGGTSAYEASAITMTQDGILYARRAGGSPATFRRDSDDGDIITLENAGTTVGTIANDSTALVVTGSSTGLKFGSAAIWPTTGGGVTNSNGAKDLGASTVKFKDLYLSNKVYAAYIGEAGDTDTSINFDTANTIKLVTGGSERMRIDSVGNVGIGVVPSSVWSSSYDALQIGLGGSIYAHSSAGNALKISSNVVYEGLAPNYYDKYLANSTATKYEQDAGLHIWSVAGSGTAGNAISWSEAMRITNDGNVGIGTTSPVSKLHVVDTQGDVAYLSSTDPDGGGATNGRVLHIRDNYATTLLDSYITTAWTSSPGQDVYIGKRTTSAAGYLSIKNSSGSELFTIDMLNGNVGINKTGGFTDGGFSSPRLVIKQTVNSVWGGINIESSADDSILAIGATDTVHYIASSYRASGGYKPIAFQTGGAERMRIDSNGSVGIGVTPATDWNSGYDALQIGQGVAIMSANFSEELFLNNNAKWASDSSWEYIATGTAASIRMDQTTPFTFRYAASGTADTDLTWSEAMRIDSSGKVLVGTTSSVIDSSSTNFNMVFPNNGGIAIGSTYTFANIYGNLGNLYLRANAYPANTGSDSIIYLQTATSAGGQADNVVVRSGKVGIGNSSPTKKLHVGVGGSSGASNYGVDGIAIEGSGNVGIQFMGGAANQQGLTFSDSGATEAGYVYYNHASNNLLLKAESNLIFNSGGANEKMRLDPSGNLLIGTDVASAKLYAKTGAEGVITKFEGPTGRYVYSGTDGGGHYMEVTGTQASERVLRLQGNNGSGTYTQLFIDAGNQRIYTSSSASVGIGTASPNGIFNVNAGVSPSGNNWVNFYNNIGGSNPPDSPGLFVGWNKSNGGGETIIGAGYGSLGSNAPQLDFALFNGTTYTTAMRITSDGNLLVGTTAVGAAGGATFNVSSNSTDLTLYGASTSHGGRLFFGDSSDRCSIQGIYDSGGGGRLTFHTDTTGGTNLERMRIDNNGRLILRDYVTNYNIGGTQFYEKRGGRRNGTGTYTLFTNGVSNTQSGGYVRVTAIYGTPSAVGVWLYKIGGNRTIDLVWSNTTNYSGTTPSVTWNSSSLQVANTNSSVYYTVEVELFNIGIGWSATWGNFPGFVS